MDREKIIAFAKKNPWTISAVAFGLVLAIAVGVAYEPQGPDGKISIGVSSDDLVGENYEDVVANLENAGFTNVETAVMDDLITGWLTSDGEVESVEIDGSSIFGSDSRFAPGTKIVVTYHTFPAEAPDAVAEEPEPAPVVTEEPAPTVADDTEKPVEKHSDYELAYIQPGPEYSLYFLIDTDKKIVWWYGSDEGSMVLRGTYTGNLNDGIDIVWPGLGNSGEDIHEQIRYQTRRDDSSIIYTTHNGTELDSFVKDSPSAAEDILIGQEEYRDIIANL